jgi:hypothetical protein
MERIPEYLPHLPQCVFQLGTDGGVEIEIREVARGSLAEGGRLKSLEADVCISFDCVLTG